MERSLGEEPACSATVSYVGAVLTPRAGGRGGGHVNREMPEDPPRLQGVGKDQSDEWEAMEVESEEDERYRSAQMVITL